MQHGVIGDAFQLLIEPFGIEINSDRRHRPALHYLLIEPFGIEISALSVRWVAGDGF